MERHPIIKTKMRLQDIDNHSLPSSDIDISDPTSESPAECLLQKLLENQHQQHELSSNDVEKEVAWWNSSERQMWEDMLCKQDASIITECVHLLLKVIQTMSTDTMSRTDRPTFWKSDISRVHVIVAVIRLVQLLLQSPKRISLSNKFETTKDDSAPIQFSMSFIDELSKSVKAHKNKQVAAFTLQLYLQILDPPFLYSSMLLLPVVWRHVCDIITLLYTDPNVLDISIIEMCTKQLIQYFHDMERHIQIFLISQLKSAREARTTVDGTLALQNHVKIVVFFITRLHSISTILISSLTCTHKQLHNTMKVELISLLCKLRGLEGATELMLQSLGIVDGTTCTALLEPLSKISHKVDSCFERFFFYKKDERIESSLNSVMQSSNKVVSHVHEGMIQLLWTVGDKMIVVPNINKDEEILAHGSLVLGHSQLLLFVLKTLTKIQRDDEWIQKRDLNINRILIDDALTICERFLFQTLPLCQPWLVNTTSRSNILYQVIQAVVDCTLTCHRSLLLVGDSTSVHHSIIRWLCTRSDEHPISIETSIVVAHMHFVRLIHYELNNRLLDSSADNLISLLSSLVIDRRTHFNLRKNISFLLCRLLRYEGQEHNPQKQSVPSIEAIISSITQKAVCKALLASSSSVNNVEVNGKRKRATSHCEKWLIDAIHLDRSNVECICLVLRMAFSRTSFWSHAGGSLKEFMNYQYNIILKSATILRRLMDFSRVPTTHQAHMKRKGKMFNSLRLAISCLPGIVASQSSIDDFNINDLFTHFISIFSHFMSDGNDTSGSDVCNTILQTVQMAGGSECFYLAHTLMIKVMPATTTQKHTEISYAFQFRALSLISSVAHLIPSDVSNQFLLCCSNLFHSVTRSLLWPNSLGAMQYFEKFAATLATVHRNVLLRCISTDSQSLVFQCRLKGENHYSKNIHPNFLVTKLKENSSNRVMQSFNRRKSIRSELDIVLIPHSRVFCLRNNAGFFIIPSTTSSSDDEYLRQLLNGTDSFTEVILSRYMVHDAGLLLKATGHNNK